MLEINFTAVSDFVHAFLFMELSLEALIEGLRTLSTAQNGRRPNARPYEEITSSKLWTNEQY